MKRILTLLFIWVTPFFASGLNFLNLDFSWYEVMNFPEGYSYPGNPEKEIHSGITLYVADIKYGYFSWSPGYSTVLTLRYLNSGSIPETDETGTITGEFSYQVSDLIVSHTYGIKKFLHLFTDLGILYENTEDYRNICVHSDMGMEYEPGINNLSLYLILRNLGWNQKGLAMPIYAELSALAFIYGFKTAIKGEYGKEHGPFFSFSLYKRLSSLLGISFSYSTEGRETVTGEKMDFMKGTSFGMDVNWKNLRVFLSYSPGVDLPDLIQTTVRLRY